MLPAEPTQLIPRQVQEAAKRLNLSPEAAYRAFSLTSEAAIACPCRRCEQPYNHRQHEVCPWCGADGAPL
jgi:rRNA maturation endonuclease Nob1